MDKNPSTILASNTLINQTGLNSDRKGFIGDGIQIGSRYGEDVQCLFILFADLFLRAKGEIAISTRKDLLSCKVLQNILIFDFFTSSIV